MPKKSLIGSLMRNQDKTPVSLAPAGAYRGANRFPLGGRADRRTYLQAYGMSGTVFSIVSLLAGSPASTEWHLYKKQPADARRRYSTSDTGSDNRIEVVQHAALSLWNSPNDFHTTFEFSEGCNQHLELTGETWWVLGRSGGLAFPTSMWYVTPDRMEPVPSPDAYLQGYIYTAPNGDQVPLQLDEVILEKMPDPLDPYRGAGPVASILPNIEQQRYATEYQRNMFQNGASPGGVVQLPTTLNDDEWDEFNDRWRESHRGVSRAGAVAVLENGATWIDSVPNNRDMEYGNLRLANRDELREAWRIHKSMLGSTEDVNRANAQTAEEVFGSWQLVPRLNRRKNTLNKKLLPLYGTTGVGVEFDYDNPLPDDREQDNAELTAKVQGFQILVNAGVDPSDAAEVVGLPDMKMVEKATQAPAIPPGWVPDPAQQPALPAAPAEPDKPDPPDMENELVRMIHDHAYSLNGHSKVGR